MNSSDGMLIVNVSAIQAVAIAAVTYYFGAWLRKKVPLLEKYSVPSPVVGGMLVALVLSCLEYFRLMQVNFDTSLDFADARFLYDDRSVGQSENRHGRRQAFSVVLVCHYDPLRTAKLLGHGLGRDDGLGFPLRSAGGFRFHDGRLGHLGSFRALF